MEDRKFIGVEISENEVLKQLAQAKCLASMSRYDIDYNPEIFNKMAMDDSFRRSIQRFMKMYIDNELNQETIDSSRIECHYEYYKKELIKDSRRYRSVPVSDFLSGRALMKVPRQKSLKSIQVASAINKYCPEIKNNEKPYDKILDILDSDSYLFVVFFRILTELLDRDDLELKEVSSEFVKVKERCMDEDGIIDILKFVQTVEDKFM